MGCMKIYVEQWWAAGLCHYVMLADELSQYLVSVQALYTLSAFFSANFDYM